MNLIYSHSYASARIFALHQELMPGDWKWISDGGVVRQNSRADIYIAPRWQDHPQRSAIDEALQRAQRDHRLGTVTDCGSGGTTLGISGA